MPLLRFQAYFQAKNNDYYSYCKMMHAVISFEDRDGDLEKLFVPELKALNMARSTCKMKKNNDSLVFDVEANDSVALRATLTSITKVVTVFENAKEVLHGKS